MESGSTGASGRGGGEISQERQPLGLREDSPELAAIRTAQIQRAERAKLYQNGSRLANGPLLPARGESGERPPSTSRFYERDRHPATMPAVQGRSITLRRACLMSCIFH